MTRGFFATVWMGISILLVGCDKANEFTLPPIENYWTVEEELYRVNPRKGTAWVDNLNAVVSTSTAESLLLIQFKNKPSAAGIYRVKTYSPTGAGSLSNDECAVAVIGAPGMNSYSSIGKAGEEVEVIEIEPGKLKYFASGLEVRSGTKSSLLTFSVIEK